MQSGPIPNSVVEFSRKVIQLAKDEGMLSFKAEFRCGFAGANWSDTVKVEWTKGRHGEPAKVHIESSQHQYLDV